MYLNVNKDPFILVPLYIYVCLYEERIFWEDL